jgi:PAS domain S-box-containing protein
MNSDGFCEATLHALTSSICVVDAKGKIIFVNDAWRQFADQNPPAPPDYALHANYLDICEGSRGAHSEGAGEFANGIRSVLNGTATSFELTYPCHSPDVRRWFLGRVAPMTGTSGPAAVISHTDITSQHLALVALSEAEQRFRSLFELSGTGIVIIDRDGMYKMVNRRAAEQMGAPAEQIVNKTIFDFFPHDVARTYVLQNREVIDSGIGRDYEASFVLGGTERTFLISDRRITDASGQGIALQSSSLDITDRKRLQDSLRALAGHLQSAREDERRFIAREIHDHFSQILSALKIDLMLMVKEQQQEGGGNQSGRLAEQLSSIDATIESIIFDLRNLVTRLRPEMLESVGIVATMAFEASQFQRATGLRTTFTSSEPHLPMDIDSSMALYRILQEALTNIRRHAQASNVSIRCTRSGGFLTLQVEDDGIGFPEVQPADVTPYGILSMKERAVLLKGDFSLSRTDKHTTMVEVHIPLDGPATEETR